MGRIYVKFTADGAGMEVGMKASQCSGNAVVSLMREGLIGGKSENGETGLTAVSEPWSLLPVMCRKLYKP
jgi:hypothetical protein